MIFIKINYSQNTAIWVKAIQLKNINLKVWGDIMYKTIFKVCFHYLVFQSKYGNEKNYSPINHFVYF